MVDIATGSSRKTVKWKNEQMSWEDLVSRLSQTHRTAESYADYLAMPKDRQDEIKDVGGFVGGYLKSGARTKGSCKHRQLLTLDIDFGTMDIWETFTMFYGCAAAIYSTHKHSEESPRFRLVIPLHKAVSREQYEAIGRKIAESLDIDLFDGTTFQPERLMYWPSTSKDGAYYFQSQDGEFLDPKSVLDLYKDWRDIQEWPICESESKLVSQSLKKQEDPTTKSGQVGAFCRAYSISEAIEEFLPTVYERGEDGRYTFTEGSTSGGAVVYDDLFLFSHHSSDPVSGILCNAFDLVRIHKYGQEDKDKTLPVTKQESYSRMLDLISSDGPVIRELGVFNGMPQTDWTGDLDMNKKTGLPKATIDNLVLILQNDELLNGSFAYNKFDYREYIKGATPWNESEEQRLFSDKDDAGLRHYLEKMYKIFNANKTRDAIDVCLMTNGWHPVKDYLNGLVWDGVSRVETVFIDALGAADNRYTRAVTRKALAAAVARIFQPGVKFDYVLTLVGAQGLGKSSIFRELGKDWYSDSLGNIQGKEAYEQIQGVWIVEMGELAGLKKAEVEVIKHFITKQTDRYRVAYGRRVDNFPRQCVFFGTTNEAGFLRDATGNRRFWPVEVFQKYEHGRLNIDQIWAEAKHLYEQKEHLYLNEVMEAEAAEVQRNHSESDERVGLIEDYLNTLLPEGWESMNRAERRSWLSADELAAAGIYERDRVCIAEIWCEVLKAELKDMTSNNTKFIHGIMQNIPGWKRDTNKKFPIYGYQRAYTRVRVKKQVKVC